MSCRHLLAVYVGDRNYLCECGFHGPIPGRLEEILRLAKERYGVSAGPHGGEGVLLCSDLTTPFPGALEGPELEHERIEGSTDDG